MNAIRPIATLLATAALATLPLAANAHKDNAKHDHGTNAHAQEPQGVDKVLTPEQIDLSSGKAILDANDHYHVRILRIQIPANKELQPQGRLLLRQRHQRHPATGLRRHLRRQQAADPAPRQHLHPPRRTAALCQDRQRTRRPADHRHQPPRWQEA